MLKFIFMKIKNGHHQAPPPLQTSPMCRSRRLNRLSLNLLRTSRLIKNFKISFEDILNQKFRKFGLNPYSVPIPKFMFLEFWLLLDIIFHHRHPTTKALLWRKTCWATSRDARRNPSSGMARTRCEDSTSKQQTVEPKVVTNLVFAPPTPLFRS